MFRVEALDITTVVRFICPSSGLVAVVTTTGGTQPFYEREETTPRIAAELPCPECGDLHIVLERDSPGVSTPRE